MKQPEVFYLLNISMGGFLLHFIISFQHCIKASSWYQLSRTTGRQPRSCDPGTPSGSPTFTAASFIHAGAFTHTGDFPITSPVTQRVILIFKTLKVHSDCFSLYQNWCSQGLVVKFCLSNMTFLYRTRFSVLQKTSKTFKLSKTAG